MSDLGSQIQTEIDDIKSLRTASETPDGQPGDDWDTEYEAFAGAVQRALDSAAPDTIRGTDGTITADVDNDATTTGELSVSGSPAGKALDSDSSPTVTQAFRVAVGATTTQDVFSVQTPVDVIGGTINGSHTSTVTAYWDDGSSTDISGGIPQGQDIAGDYYSSVPIPPLEDVTRVSFVNSSGSARDYGWTVVMV